jgi:hypothetical protein
MNKYKSEESRIMPNIQRVKETVENMPDFKDTDVSVEKAEKNKNLWANWKPSFYPFAPSK